MALLMQLRRIIRDLGLPRATVHGFRASFRTWVAEQTDTPETIAEQALAHVVGDATVRAYRRSDGLQKSRHLMVEWARFVAG